MDTNIQNKPVITNVEKQGEGQDRDRDYDIQTTMYNINIF